MKEYFYGSPLADRQFLPSRMAVFFHDVMLFRVPAGVFVRYMFGLDCCFTGDAACVGRE